MSSVAISKSCVGILVGAGLITASALYTLFRLRASITEVIRKSKHPTALNVDDIDRNLRLKLIEKRHVSHDTKIFRFELPSKNHVLGLPLGQHVRLSATVNGSLVTRAYTPISDDSDVGYMDILIKVYFRDVHPKFPEGGKLTQHINDMQLGDRIDVNGPVGRLSYKGNGEFGIRAKKNADPSQKTRMVRVKKVNMIAGGSGIAPMLQLIKAIFKDVHDESLVSLIFANQTEEDILCREDLEKIRDENPSRFKLWYTVDRPPSEGWKYSSGYVTDDMMKEHLFPPSDDTITLMCGPSPMIKSACNPNLDKLGYDENLRFKY